MMLIQADQAINQIDVVRCHIAILGIGQHGIFATALTLQGCPATENV